MVDLLLLQGPVGSFFKDLQRAAEAQGLSTMRLTFDRYDDLMSGKSMRFDGDYEAILTRFSPKIIILFGCGRPHHMAFLRLAKAQHIPVFCLEEGYWREGFVSCEAQGNNALSPLITHPLDSLSPLQHGARPRFAFTSMALYALLRYLCIAFPDKKAIIHRPRSLPSEIKAWVKNVLLRFKPLPALPHEFFLVALQVYDDAALTAFGKGWTSEKLIEIFKSRQDIVFKIHPLERGHRHYDIPLVNHAPLGELLRQAKGLITINSTAALIAFSLNKPVFAFGEAFYQREGLASQQTLEEFLANPTPPTLWPQLKSAIFETALIRGDFYAQNRRCETVQGVLNKLYGT